MRKSLKDFAHIVRWCLKDNAPVPRTENELDEWACALDERVSELERFEPGALFSFCPGGGRTLEDARQGFRKRLVETPGVVSTVGEGEKVDCSIYVNAITYRVDPKTNAHFHKLRKDMLTPDGWQLMQATDVWRHAKELALGFHQVWDPRPPDPWRNARRNWNAFVREVLSKSRTLDSPLMVANACDAGRLDDSLLRAWRAVEKSYDIHTKAIWHDDTVINLCLEWMKQPGIVWTEHVEFATRLAKLSGCKYYGAKGKAADGSNVLDADPTKAAVLSMDANREGLDLQFKWHRNLVTSCPEGADILQQLIGRTHRTGQPADEVTVDILLGCLEHANAWRRAWQNAEVIRDTTGAVYKILNADINWPEDDEIETYQGARWGVA
jgi:hypothetical protein